MSKINQGRRTFLKGFGWLSALLAIEVLAKPLSFTKRPDPITVRITLRQLLSREFGGNWQSWTRTGRNGQGIWSINGLVQNGLCHIKRNHQLIIGDFINLDTIDFISGDRLDICNPQDAILRTIMV